MFLQLDLFFQPAQLGVQPVHLQVIPNYKPGNLGIKQDFIV